MAKKKVEIGRVKGVRYKLVFDQYKNQQACDDSIACKWAWFLWVGAEYEGNFKNKHEATEYLEEVADEIYCPDTSELFMVQGK